MVAISFLSLTKSRLVEMSCLLLLPLNRLVLIVENLVSKGMTASKPYIIENRVSLVDLLCVVWYADST